MRIGEFIWLEPAGASFIVIECSQGVWFSRCSYMYVFVAAKLFLFVHVVLRAHRLGLLFSFFSFLFLLHWSAGDMNVDINMDTDMGLFFSFTGFLLV